MAAQAPPIPEFPWPPPRPTAVYALPAGLVVNGQVDTLTRAFFRVRSELARAGIYEWSAYGIDSTRSGFAVVTRIERIDTTGAPYPGASRFPSDLYARDPLTSFGDWLKAVFRARPGFYRVIALLVTQKPVVATGPAITPGEARQLLAEGADRLALYRHDQTIQGAQCTALIYEFERRSNMEPVKQRQLSLVPPTRHLSAAGLWLGAVPAR